MKSTFKHIVVSILTLEARVALMRHKPKIVAVTGNVGKTSTKDAVYAVLAHAYGESAVRKSQKSLNSEIGLPLAILGLETAWSSLAGWISNMRQGFAVAFLGKSFPEWLVLEIGADHPGDIETVSKWLHPDIVVLTRMSDVPVHVEFFKDAADVLKEKMFLARALKSGGTLVVNADDPHFAGPVSEIDAKKILYGASKEAAVEIVESEISYDAQALPLPSGQYMVVRIKGDDTQAEREVRIDLLGVLGDHIMYPFAAACGVAKALGIQSSIPVAFQGFESPRGRMRILRGANLSAVIDDTYNSSPLACAEALKTVAKLGVKGKKIAILADMKELGDNTGPAHRNIGRQAADILHTLVTVGDMAKSIASGALDAGLATDRVHSFNTAEEAGKAIRDIIRAGDIVLVKGSQSMRMEKAVKELIADPNRAGELLVRQEEEWMRR